jgi:tRNA (cmo5U34)-methyltransferase
MYPLRLSVFPLAGKNTSTTHKQVTSMKNKKPNTWLSQDSRDLIDYYLSSADIIVIQRKRFIKLLTDIIGYHFTGNKKLAVLDAGCGDGSVAAHVMEKYPGHSFVLMDGSPEMLTRAREKLRGAENVSFLCRSFEDLCDDSGDGAAYDVIFSSNAIHHLDINGKSRLYNKFYSVLNSGGLFLNYDVVQPSSARSEQWQFNMWRDWMNEQLAAKDCAAEVGKHDGLPDLYKSKKDNHPDSLFDQLQVLEKTGFRDVDCFFKHGIFALFGGTK